MNMVFHVSELENLRTIEPQVSTHGISYVYAIDHLPTALLFGAPKDDFDLIIDYKDERAIVYECYKNAFREVYHNKRCSVYELEEVHFLRGLTGWSPELVSRDPVEVKGELKISNLYEALLEEVKNGTVILHMYSDSIEYKKIISNHVIDRLVRFEILDGEVPQKLKEKFPKIIKSLEKLLSGAYL